MRWMLMKINLLYEAPNVNVMGKRLKQQYNLKARSGSQYYGQLEGNCWNIGQALAARYGYSWPSQKQLRDYMMDLKSWEYDRIMAKQEGLPVPSNPRPLSTDLGRSRAHAVMREGDSNSYHVTFELDGKEYNYGPHNRLDDYVVRFKLPLAKL